jgi:hypothetical protein
LRRNNTCGSLPVAQMIFKLPTTILCTLSPDQMISTYKTTIRLTLALATAVLAAGCASSGKPAACRPGLLEAGNPQVLLLGEVHDNAQGHKLRYELLRQRVEAGWRPAIVMEQFDRENQDLLDKAQKAASTPSA